ncbi:MAG: hypothetical protein WCB85_08950 [Candidatus Dormiibacterota bacterium]
MMKTDDYFTMRAAAAPTKPGRYVDVEAMDPVEVLPGLGVRPVVRRRAMVNFVSFAPHTEAPTHVHEGEQIAIVVEGDLEMVSMAMSGPCTVGSWPSSPPGCRIFSPPRHALLERLRRLTGPSESDG